MREVKQSFVFNSKLRSLHPAAANLREVTEQFVYFSVFQNIPLASRYNYFIFAGSIL